MELKNNVDQTTLINDELTQATDFKYNLLSWIKGDVDYKDFERLIEAGEISEKEVYLIGVAKYSALKYLANASITAYINTFKEAHKLLLVQDEFLEEQIKSKEALLSKFREKRQYIIDDLISVPRLRKSEHFNISVDDVVSYLTKRWDDVPASLILKEIGPTELLEKPHLFYVVFSNYLKWMKWFERQNKLSNVPPVLFPNGLDDSSEATQLRDVLKDNIISYKWLSNPNEELPELYQLLTAKKLIHSSTILEPLKAVFTATSLQEIVPIKWHNDNASELLYFVMQLESTASIEASKQTNYQRLKACFVKPDGMPFENAFKSLKQRVEIELSEQKQQTIRDILNSFL